MLPSPGLQGLGLIRRLPTIISDKSNISMYTEAPKLKDTNSDNNNIPNTNSIITPKDCIFKLVVIDNETRRDSSVAPTGRGSYFPAKVSGTFDIAIDHQFARWTFEATLVGAGFACTCFICFK